MRIGVVWDYQVAASFYRAIQPLTVLDRRGHDVVWPTPQGELVTERLVDCDVVHVYRLCNLETQAALRELSARGVAINWDNDDDYSAVPEDSEFFRSFGAEEIAKMLKLSLRAARFADQVTVTSEWLADRYRRAGAKRVEVIDNCALDERTPLRRHDGIVIGWIAGWEHQSDARQLDLKATMQRIQAEHQDVRVVSIGADLGLDERYEHERLVRFAELPERMASFDIGIAPIADRPHNHARSSIKVKEYAASGVPWLASDLTPYHGLGADQGGRLVPDDGWFAALDGLIRHPEERLQLSKRGRAWARTESINRVADRWERAFAQAIAAKRATARAAD